MEAMDPESGLLPTLAFACATGESLFAGDRWRTRRIADGFVVEDGRTGESFRLTYRPAPLAVGGRGGLPEVECRLWAWDRLPSGTRARARPIRN
jgi:hypothetical protein